MVWYNTLFLLDDERVIPCCSSTHILYVYAAVRIRETVVSRRAARERAREKRARAILSQRRRGYTAREEGSVQNRILLREQT